MDDSVALGRAQTILEAVKLTLDANITSLGQLVATYPEVLKTDLVLRIVVTFLPESTDPAQYIEFLRTVSTSSLKKGARYAGPVHSGLSDLTATSRVRRLYLLPLADPSRTIHSTTDPLTLFLLHRAHRIDDETGSLLLISRLIEPFLGHSEQLREWAISNLLPVLRFDYDYYSQSGLQHPLYFLEATSTKFAIDFLLSQAENKDEDKSYLGRDLKGLVGPWMYGYKRRKRRKRKPADSGTISVEFASASIGDENDTVGGWNDVYEWLLNLAVRDYTRAVAAMLQWNGPVDVDYGDWDEGELRAQDAHPETIIHAQACLAFMYASNDWSPELLQSSYWVIQKIAKSTDVCTIPELKLEHANDLGELSSNYLHSLSQRSFLSNLLLHEGNLLTAPSKDSLHFCYLLLLANTLLESLGRQIGLKELAELGLFGSEAEQLAELRRLFHEILSKPKNDDQWEQTRRQILWLRDWGTPAGSSGEENAGRSRGVFGRVDTITLEVEVLKLLLNASHYECAQKIYCEQLPGPIPIDALEETVLNTALAYFDSASNGHRARGGVRRASEIVGTFHRNFPRSKSVHQILALLSATHAMSFYSLTLQHGVPFQPVNIRAHRDPVSLIGKILMQNIHSYTKLDDLLEIGENLALAGLINLPQGGDLQLGPGRGTEASLVNVKRRVTAMSIEAALAEDDFDTAYSYVVNRLPSPKISTLSISRAPNVSIAINDDISWRAAYKAGGYTSTKSGGTSTLRRLEQRMELLSHALLLAPASELSEVLTGWRECEQELASLSAQEAEEDEKWDDRGDQRLPGGYTFESSPIAAKRREPNLGALAEEAPMGLFDVARGAASALKNNAFPLRSARNAETDTPSLSAHERSVMTRNNTEIGTMPGADPEGRVRKRDMVSNIVTGGLASSIGWVIGAPPNRSE